MSDEQGLLDAIVADPDDDTPRLVYADWLEDHGREARARLIRVQCEIQRLLASADSGDLARARLLRETEERPLIEANAVAWCEELPTFDGLKWLGDEPPDTYLDRGFFTSLRADHWDALRLHGEAAFAASPVRRLTIRNLGKRAARSLAGWPMLGRVEELDLDETELGDSALAALAYSGHLGRLRRLILTKCNLTSDGVAALARQGWLAQVRHLDLGSNRLDPRAGQLLAQSGKLGALDELSLNANWGVSDGGVLPLVEAGCIPPVLVLGGVDLRSAALVALAAAPASTRARSLHLGWNYIGDPAGRALAESPHLAALSYLDLRSNSLSAEVSALLRQRFVATAERPFTLWMDDPAGSTQT